MNPFVRGSAAIISCLLATVVSAAPVNDRTATPLAELAAKMPLRFEANAGQVKEPGVRYFARGRGYRLSLGSAEAVFHLGSDRSSEETVRLHLAGGAKHSVPVGIDPLPTKSNYLEGRDPRAWHTGVASFAGVRYEEVYPGTDLVFAGNERRVEQSFYLAAGAEPRRIRMVYEGAATVEVGKTGELLLRTPGEELTADRPVAYQVVGGERRTVECRYELSARGTAAPVVGFALGAYDRELPLVIDPVFSNFVTPLNGSGDDIGHAIGVDGAGNVYIAGSTTSTDFIGTIGPGGVQSSPGGDRDGFVAKVDPTGTTLLYSTYLGGSGLDEITGIAVDSAGNAYLTGYTFSSDFPGVTAASPQSGYAGGRDAFVTKLSPTGSALLYSTYLGGTGSDLGYSVAVDGSGNAVVTGFTRSNDFPGVSAASIQASNAGGDHDVFVTKINATGGAIVYSTYLGGSGDDIANHVAVDTAGNAVITGGTCSANFPVTAGALAPVSPGLDCGTFLYDAFVAKLNPLGTALLYSTFLGGTDNDVAQGLAVDPAGNAYVTGFTRSNDFTGVTAGSFQPANPGGYAAFLTKINPAGNAVGYSTYLGGGGTFGNGVAVDSTANAYVTGTTGDGYPIVNAETLFQSFPGGSSAGFATKVAASGTVVYSTYLAGQSGAGYAIAADSTRETVFVTGARDGSGSRDAFLIRIAPSAVLSIAKTADVAIVDPGGKITYTLTYRNFGELDAAGASLTETVPDNTVFKLAGSSPGWSCTPSEEAGSTCTLALGTVPAGAGGTATFAVKVKAKLSAGGGEILNRACANPGPSCAFAHTPTTAAPVLSITKTANFTDAKPGNVLRYTIKAFNTGNEDSAVTLTDTVPGNTVFDPATSTPGWSCAPDGSAGSICTFPVANLAVGSHATAVFAVTLSTVLSNTACVQAAGGTPELLRRTLSVPVCATATTPLK
ncbi:MAG: hypothetical protein QOJ16_1049 [Acidobacteriota bacterium]|jgi:uncharacterized repeat protein (TIGR01451 family)|nr:hypothetical protein [Acidobacteriota bacterium]